MKRIFIIASSFLAFHLSNAQNIEVYKNGFAGLSPGWSSNYFAQSDINGSKFLYDTWVPGSVTNLANQTFSSGYVFLFDKVAQSLYVKTINTDSSIILVIDKAQISSFILTTDKPHVFIAGKIYGSAHENDFFEVLTKNDSAYTLLKLVTTKFVRADTHNLLKAINGDTKSSYVDNVLYFISYKKGILQKVNLTEKSFKSALIIKEAAIQNYILQNEKHNKNEQFYIGMVDAANK